MAFGEDDYLKIGTSPEYLYTGKFTYDISLGFCTLENQTISPGNFTYTDNPELMCSTYRKANS